MEDLYAFIIKHCKITASQKEELRTCPFARESEVFPDLSDSLSTSPTPPASPEPTVIEMVSLPDSVSGENEEFQTPPEHANSSSQPYLSGSEDLRPPIAAAALGSRSDSPRVKQAATADEGGAEHHGIVDLGTDCDDLGSSEPRVTNAGVSAYEGSGSANGLHGNEGCGDDSNCSESFNGNNDEHGSKRIRVSEEDLGVDSPTLYAGETEPTATEIKNDESANNDVIDLEHKEARKNEKKMVNLDSPANALAYTGRICEDESSIKGSKRTGDTEELDIVNSGKAAKEKEKCNDAANEKGKYDGVPGAEKKDAANRKEKCDVVGRRELPLSIKGREKSTREKEETERKVGSKNKSSFQDLMADVEVVLGKADDGHKDASLLETAMKCGWVFPKPSWWPPEGYDD